MDKISNYLFPGNLSWENFVGIIQETFSIDGNFNRDCRQIYFDTFDWRLHKQGLILAKEGNSYKLLDIATEDPQESILWSTRKKAAFWWEFPEGALKNRLENILSVRALIPPTPEVFSVFCIPCFSLFSGS